MKKMISGLIVGIVFIAVLFYIAGTWTWWNAWVFIVLMAIIGGFTSNLFKKSPGLAEERKTANTKSKPWDVKLVRLINIALPSMVIIAAFDNRFHFFPAVPLAVSVVALLLMIMAATLTYLSIAANPFFSSHVRIQEDRDHKVMTTGPYRIIRHPGYAGSMIFNLSVAMVLGSWAALPIGLATILLLIYRTAKEDRVLTVELTGYYTYTQQVRYRLLPGVW
jgi:protein-S-isoprenylcysteine O-methyltransferase Ste14